MRKFSYVILLAILVFGASCAVAQKSTEKPKDTDKPAKTSLEYLEEGSAAYMRRNYKAAIEPYQKALDLEKAESKLEKSLWLVLIDNLSMSYGITGNFEKSKEALDYGISKDSTYPMFYYIMACNYGEMSNEDKAIEYLRLGYKYKENMIEGEVYPDPATDDSFQKFMKSEKFLKALKEMKK